jgi:hypothetical protein
MSNASTLDNEIFAAPPFYLGRIGRHPLHGFASRLRRGGDSYSTTKQKPD